MNDHKKITRALRDVVTYQMWADIKRGSASLMATRGSQGSQGWTHCGHSLDTVTLICT
jgi:hypothetical protein